MGGRSHLAHGQCPALGTATRYGQAAVPRVPLFLRRPSRQPRTTLLGLHQGGPSAASVATVGHRADSEVELPAAACNGSVLRGQWDKWGSMTDKSWNEMSEGEKLDWLKGAVEQIAAMVRSIEPTSALRIKRVEERIDRLEGKGRT
jgi:hypothetical protein